MVQGAFSLLTLLCTIPAFLLVEFTTSVYIYRSLRNERHQLHLNSKMFSHTQNNSENLLLLIGTPEDVVERQIPVAPEALSCGLVNEVYN